MAAQVPSLRSEGACVREAAAFIFTLSVSKEPCGPEQFYNQTFRMRGATEDSGGDGDATSPAAGALAQKVGAGRQVERLGPVGLPAGDAHFTHALAERARQPQV